MARTQKTKRVNVRVDPETMKVLERLAEAANEPIASLVRRALGAYLNQEFGAGEANG